MNLHTTDTEIFEENFEESEEAVDFLLRKIESKQAVSGLDRIRNAASEYVYYGCYQADHTVTEDNVEQVESIYRHLYLYLQCSTNLFTLSKSTRDEEALSVDDMEIDFVTDGYQGYVGIAKWKNLFMAALIGRETSVQTLLSQVSVEDLKADGGLADDYYYTYVTFLNALGTAEAVPLLAKVREQLKSATILRPEYKECLIEPQIELWETVLNRDEAAFHAALEKGVEKHQQYWSQQKDDDGGQSYRCNNPDGFVAMDLTAIAAYAFDQGLAVTYRSAYLPRFFVEGYMKIDAKVTMPG